MADFDATSMDEFTLSTFNTLSTFETIYITQRPAPTPASKDSENESQPNLKETTNRDKQTQNIKIAPSTTTRTAPYSALPFHRPKSTGDGWGQGEGHILSPLDVDSAFVMQYPRLKGVDHMRIAKIYSGAYTFGLCLITVAGLALARWIWNGCPTAEEYRKKRRLQEEQEKWSRWF
jgi:hypothetical protein